ncbi:GerAB/ArcD/ProY family transporter [Paenibacillus caui]|uniref:GerAB/ArcD/ProY family transporter n=1 Tax=Paenibacillus caui TaxID=2873927 RepID=UPI001CA92101|nr:endospore germination permease [Paenibacillus caui]
MNRSTPTGQITPLQTQAIVISSIVGIGVLTFPTYMAQAADSGGPLVTLLGIVFSCISLIPLSLVGRRFPKENIVVYSGKLIGKWPTLLFCFTLILMFLLVTGGIVRETAEAISLIVLPRTPPEITAIMLLSLTALSARRNIIKFSYIHTFYLPFILVPGLIILIGSLRNADYLNLLPFTGIHPKNVISGALTIMGLFQVSFILAMVIPHMSKPQKALNCSFWSIACAGALYLFIVTASTAVFGAEEMKEMVYPTLELARSSSISVSGLQRVDGIFIIVWVLTVFTTLISTYYISLYLIGRIFDLQDHRMLATFLIPFVFIVSLIPQDFFQLYDSMNLISIVGLCLTFGYPLLLYIISFIQKGVRGNETTG